MGLHGNHQGERRTKAPVLGKDRLAAHSSGSSRTEPAEGPHGQAPCHAVPGGVGTQRAKERTQLRHGTQVHDKGPKCLCKQYRLGVSPKGHGLHEHTHLLTSEGSRAALLFCLTPSRYWSSEHRQPCPEGTPPAGGSNDHIPQVIPFQLFVVPFPCLLCCLVLKIFAHSLFF